jgi:transcriptional regulator with XRE-family HTH domain
MIKTLTVWSRSGLSFFRHFADSILNLRPVEGKGLADGEICRRLQCPSHVHGHIERGEKNVSFNTLVRLADAVGITVAELLSDETKAGPKNSTLSTENQADPFCEQR